jgi:hypothetical protein
MRLPRIFRMVIGKHLFNQNGGNGNEGFLRAIVERIVRKI